jgi:RNA-directed DNA polymerase
MGKDGSVSVKEQTARDGDTLVNTGVVAWPDEDSAWATVRRMQLKLHRWASEDSARRFGDLFNLVYDPAFLIHAWERVRSNDGARTAGIDAHGSSDRNPGRGARVPGSGPGLAEIW